ncbi:unnamed protein product [Urochloa humidicola]
MERSAAASPIGGDDGEGTATELPQQNAAAGDDDRRGGHQPGSEPAGLGWLPPSLRTLLRSAISSESGDPGRPPSFELRCLVSLAKSYLPHPPPPPPARRITHGRMQYRFHASPEVVLNKSKRFAKGALDHYNKRMKIKFELMDVMPVNMIIESLRLYTHLNFKARSAKEGSNEQLFFAELENCSKRRAPRRFIVSYCEPLGSDSTVGHKGFQLDYGTSGVEKNVDIDITYCFACDSRMLHPRVDKYIAGHCNIPHVYTNTC